MDADALAYEMTVEVSSEDLRIHGTIINRSARSWLSSVDDGELRIGVRTISGRRVINTASLPPLAPGQEVKFEIDIPSNLAGGRHDVWIEPFRHGEFWFSDKGQKPHRATIKIGSVSPYAREHQEFGAELAHPYRGLPDWAFWKRGVAERTPDTLEPVVDVPFVIDRKDRVATAGSCFAQRLSAYLDDNGFNFFRTEDPLETDGPMYSANYGNIYTTLQLHQLLQRAFGLIQPADIAWKRADGRYIDPFRPQLYAPGYATEAEVVAARDEHLLAVRRLFTESDVFIFTLGLTETWVNMEDGIALPVTPGAVARQAGHGPYQMVNLSVEQVTRQLGAFIEDVRLLCPFMRIVLTVSPVPLVATYEHRHVLSSTTLSKSVLRVAADAIERAYSYVSYFPSYEIITGPLMGNSYFEPDLRSIRPEGVANVMRVFSDSYLGGTATVPTPARRRSAELPQRGQGSSRDGKARPANGGESLRHILCDENLLEV